MKLDITKSCGHVENYDVRGQRSARWIAREEAQKCWACEKVERAAEATIWARAEGLVPLEGSEKQVPWAETIRADKLRSRVWAQLQAEIEEARAEGLIIEAGAAADFLESVLQTTEARWWIDHRDKNFLRLGQEAAWRAAEVTEGEAND